MSDHQEHRGSGESADERDHNEQIFEQNLARLLAAGEAVPSLPADQASRMLRQLRILQQAQSQERQRQLAEPRPADPADPFAKERTMHRPNTFAARLNDGPWNDCPRNDGPRNDGPAKNGQCTPGMSSVRPQARRSHWQGLAVAAAVSAMFVAWAFRAGRPPVEPRGGSGVTPVVAAAEIGQVTRQKLDDGTIVVARPGTKFTTPRPRELSLERGEIYLIVAKSTSPFIVTTPHGEAKATGTRFYVSTNPDADAPAGTQTKTGETRAAVAQGTVTLSGGGGSVALRAGQQGVLPGGGPPTRHPAPRLSYLVSWAKEALSQDELLVAKPAAEAGLIAVDPWGQEVRLTLRKYLVDVYIEDGIARTTIDQTYFNHNPWNTEGTFYFPLPPDASVSRLAMYVSGKLNEGGMVSRQRGQQIYDEIRYQNRDPALLEMMEGNVFKMRIFPLEGRQEKRIFLSYTQKLSELYGTLRYWFPMEHTHHLTNYLSLRVHVKGGAGQYDASSSTHKLKAETQDKDLVLTYSAERSKLNQDFLLHLLPTKDVQPAQAATFESEGLKYFFCRMTPELKSDAAGRAESSPHRPRQWIVLNDVSASRSKIDVKAQRYIVRRLLAEADDGDSLAVVDVNTAAHRVLPLVPMQQLRSADRTLGEPLSPRHPQYPWPERDLLGATNLQATFEAAAAIIRENQADRPYPDNPHIVYLGDGVATDGKTEMAPLLKALPAGATFLGLGVGKKVDSRLLQAAADATGGMFATINPDEDIDWRVFDLLAALNTPRLTGVELALQDAAGRPVEAIAYPSARAISAGETLFVVSRSERELPATVVLRGTAVGKKFEQSYSLAGSNSASAKKDAAYIPRFWAKQHIDELLKEGDKHQAEIERLSKQYYVMTPYTSLIVLENDKMYEEFKVERGRKDHWALYPAPAEIPVVREELDWGHTAWWWGGGGGKGEDAKIAAKAQPRSVPDIVESVQFRINAPFYYSRPQPDDCAGRFALYRLVDGKGKPSRLLTYLYLLASQRARGTRPSATSGAAQANTVEANARASGDFGLRRTILALDGWMSPGVHFQTGFHRVEPQRNDLFDIPRLRQAEGFTRAQLFGVEPFGMTVASGKRPAQPLLLELEFDEKSFRESLPKLLAMDEAPSRRLGWLSPLGGFGMAEDKKRLFAPFVEDYESQIAPTLAGLGGGARLDLSAVSRLPSAMLDSYLQALSTRWSRINRDIHQFNRQHGYWDWDTDAYGLGIGQRDAIWFDARVLVESNELKDRLPVLEQLMTEGQRPFVMSVVPVGEPTRIPSLAMFEKQKKEAPLALAWVSHLGQTMRSLPGTSSALAADHLLARRDELKKAQGSANGTNEKWTEEQKQELAAVEQALAGLGEAAARLESSAPFWSYRGWDYRPRPTTPEPPTVQLYQGYNWSYDLTSYAPALYSTSADVLNEVVAQYSQPPTQGKVSESARRRIEAARAATQPVRIRYGKEGPAVLAAAGDRFAVTRRTEMYLEERMVCDGKQILHLYDELGLAARRAASELRLASLRQLAPHFLEPADVLAKLFDVELGDSDEAGFTLKLTPLVEVDDSAASAEKKGTAKAADKAADQAEKLPELRVTMRVRRDGLVTEKSLFADGKLAAKLVYDYRADKDGERVTARWSDKDGKELAKFDFAAQRLSDEKAFEAKPAEYVVFDMPLRKPSAYTEQLKEARPLSEAGLLERANLLRHQALSSIQDLHWRRWYGSNEEAQKALAEAAKLIEQAGGKPQRGDLTLLGSTGVHPGDFVAKTAAKSAATKTEPSAKQFASVASYFANRHDGGDAADKLAQQHPGGLIGHLSAYHAATRSPGDMAVYQRLLKGYGDSPLLPAAAQYCASHGPKPEAWYPLYDRPEWRGLAILMSSGQASTPEHRHRLDAAVAAWYRDATQGHTAPVSELPVNSAIAAQLNGQAGWEAVVQEQFARAKKAEGAAALLQFAEDATAWAKKDLAEQALSVARERLKATSSDSARLALAQAYWACGKPKEALAPYEQMLADLKAKQLPASAALLAAAARLAAAAGDQARAIDLEEQSLALEHERLPDAVNLQAYRQRYQWLWERLSAKVHETAGKDPKAAAGWLARAEQAWRQWHDVDRDNPSMIHQMATAQRATGREDQAWLYLSTLIDEKPKDASSYASVAQWHAGRNELKEAERFYAQAAPWDSDNPQWLLERAQLLDRLERKAEARRLYQQIVDGTWPAGRQRYVEDAKKALK